MKLKALNIIFKNPIDFFKEIDKKLKSPTRSSPNLKTNLIFDSIKTYNNILTVNKLQILRAISQNKPESIYQLAHMLNREPHHVLKDCRHLESFKFIRLEKTTSNRNSLRPVLTFDYDVIKSNSPIIPTYLISSRAESLLRQRSLAI